MQKQKFWKNRRKSTGSKVFWKRASKTGRAIHKGFDSNRKWGSSTWKNGNGKNMAGKDKNWKERMSQQKWEYWNRH